MKDGRDKALLLIGFAGGFRRSELTAINCSDIEHVPQGIIVNVRRSKTDQEGAGRKIGIPYGRSRWCPVTALNEWLEHAGMEGGPVFRPVDRHGNLLDGRLSGEAVSLQKLVATNVRLDEKRRKKPIDKNTQVYRIQKRLFADLCSQMNTSGNENIFDLRRRLI